MNCMHEIESEEILYSKDELSQADLYWNTNLNKSGGKKLGSIKDEAMAYEPPKTLNIADLEEVPIDLEIQEKEAETY